MNDEPVDDTLPLIPDKGSICADVRPIIRTVFRELDYLPPLATEMPTQLADEWLANLSGSRGDQWTEKYKLERKEFLLRESELKRQHATRLSREPLPNIYHLSSPAGDSALGASPPYGSSLDDTTLPRWRLDQGLIVRRDLVPSIKQNAARDGSLWIKNILNRSSCDVTAVEVVGHSVGQRPVRLAAYEDTVSLQSFSIGEAVTHAALPPLTAPYYPSTPLPDYMLCVPPQLDFVNFTIGRLHTQSLRLVNISRYEIRLSVRPPKRRELDVEISGPRGLTVTAGAAAEFRVHFRPCDIRTIRDMLVIRVSMGKNFLVPIACYMQPPVLNVLIPNVTPSVLSCMPCEASVLTVRSSCDVLELGARLLGDVHCARVLLTCVAEHAAFFILTEDAWFSLSLDCVTTQGSVTAGSFVLWPAWWGGGGTVLGCAWCRTPGVGLHAAALRVVSSTAVVRHLNLVADTLLFGPDHITIVAQEKDYDICSEGEPACEYYVHLGTALPSRALSTTVQLVNKSPVVYSYYWSVRTWGVCSCLEDQSSQSLLEPEEEIQSLCDAAKEARVIKQDEPEKYAQRSENVHLVRVEPARGHVLPRSACAPVVLVPDVGARHGVQRTVLMLILTDIPRESFPPDYEPMIVSSKEVATDPIPGVESSMHEVCEIVGAQMEVWWNVVPVRFVLDPPQLHLYHSRRLDSISLDIKATQLFGWAGVRASWVTPAGLPPPAPLRLAPAHPLGTVLEYPLPSLPNHCPETDTITMVADNNEWVSRCAVTRQCATRHPSLQPERTWLGVVAPGTPMQTTLQVFNNTYQHICWWAEAFRWYGENQPSPACLGRMPCNTCHERACSCGLLRPARGSFHHQAAADICYSVNAPKCDGCVATLVRVRRTSADVATVLGAPGTEARAALVAYRVLAPSLYLRLLACLSDPKECTGCKDEDSCGCSRRGTAVLRPRQALTLGRSTCYTMLLSNVTPLPTAVHFDKEHDATDILKVKFNPAHFRVRPYGAVEVKVVVEARKVCGRRLYVYRGAVECAYKPIYLIIDCAVEGVKISCEVPLGGGVKPDSSVILQRTQKEVYSWDEGKPKPTTPEEVFADEDLKRATVIENVCHCEFQMVYLPPPPPRPAPPLLIEEESPIPIVSHPPSLKRLCPCTYCSKPLLPQLEQPICLQFIGLPLRTVRTRTLLLRNESVVTAYWSTAVRRWPRRHHRTLDTDQWAGDVVDPGVVVACSPAGGVLAARAHVPLSVRVYADCWGLYYDQLLIQVQDVEPLVLDVWVEAVGAPLQLALAPSSGTPTMWMSTSDSERVLRATNVSRAAITVHAYTALAYEYPQSELPFRLYLRYYDTLPRTCPCLTAFDSDELVGDLAGEHSEPCSVLEEVETGFEIYLAADHGPQDDSVYSVSPEVTTVRAGQVVQWSVALSAEREPPPDQVLLLRLLPVEYRGSCWQRGEPAPAAVRLREAPRATRLQLSCRELRVRLCALQLSCTNVLRVRKRFHVQNVGSGVLELGVETKAPWSVLWDAEREEEGQGQCGCDTHRAARLLRVPLCLQPRSSTEICVEVCVSASEAQPVVTAGAGGTGRTYCQAPDYPPLTVTTTPLHIYDDDDVLKTLPLLLELEFPLLRVCPPQIDFHVVADGDTRKCYFSVSHSSRSDTLDLATEWIGNNEFQIWPPFLRIAPGGSANVYLQYTAVWQAAPVEGCACVRVCATCPCEGQEGEQAVGAEWCYACVAVRATPARDYKFHVPRHDHTDDPHLLPPGIVSTHSE